MVSYLSIGQKLKSLRKSHNYTQKYLADKLDTTQQTIARWESGKATPSVKVLSDLTIIFGTSIDSLLGKDPLSKKVIFHHLEYICREDENIDYFWGHFGVLLNSRKHTYWFPITLEEESRIRNALDNMEDPPDHRWITVRTLNNRILAINPFKVNRIWLLDEAAGYPEDDWQIELDQYTGYPAEIYRSINEFTEKDPHEISQNFQSIIKGVLKELEENDIDLFDFLNDTKIHFVNGKCTSFFVTPHHLSHLLFLIDGDSPLGMIKLEDYGMQYPNYFPAEALSMIDMPQMEVLDEIKTELKEYEEEEEREIKKKASPKKTGKK